MNYWNEVASWRKRVTQKVENKQLKGEKILSPKKNRSICRHAGIREYFNLTFY